MRKKLLFVLGTAMTISLCMPVLSQADEWHQDSTGWWYEIDDDDDDDRYDDDRYDDDDDDDRYDD